MANEEEGKNEGKGGVVGRSPDPFRAYNFRLDFNGAALGHFTECSGIGVEVDVLEFREGGAGEIVRRLPGPVKYGDVTLRYGLTADSTGIWDWFDQVVRGTVERKNVSVILLNTDGLTEAMRWNLNDAWPSSWRAAPLDAMGREVAIETLTLVFESLDRVPG